MRPRRSVPLALSCAAVLLTGCGGSSLLDGSTATDLQGSLTKVRAAIDDGRCAEARTAARDGASRVDDLPSSVDADLRTTLKDGFDELASRVSTDCETPTTTVAVPTTTEEVPTTTEEVPAAPTTTEEAPETTTEETPAAPTTTDGGGAPADPDDQVEPDDGSGGVVPGVDGPGAGERSVPGVAKGLQKLRKNAEKLRRQAENALRGRGNG